MNKYRIAITGGCGFVGHSLAKHLSKDYSVTILDIREPSGSSPVGDFKACDIRDYSQVKEGIKGADIVIHTAIIQIPQINDAKNLGYEVNVLGTQNVCKATSTSKRAKGLILAGSWHTMGERGLRGLVDEEFGSRPDKVEERARLYALSKIAQSSIVRFYDEMDDKVFGIIRMGTVLGEGMPENTAANLFIEKGLRGDPITPYKHSMYRPMLYVDVNDVCRAFQAYVVRILSGIIPVDHNSLHHIVNVYYSRPTTILQLAEIVRESIRLHSGVKIDPEIRILDMGLPPTFDEADAERIFLFLEKMNGFLGIGNLVSPRESIDRIVISRLKALGRVTPNSEYSL